jgi:hypothetical protein
MKYYFCSMFKKVFLLISLLVSVLSYSEAQVFFKTADLFRKPETEEKSGSLNIFQQPGVDTLISRYVLANRKLNGLDGFRIQIYRSSNKNARDESSKERARFMVEFPDIPSYAMFAEPAYFLVKAGDYRTKMEGTKQLISIRKKFPNAYLVPDIINFPDLNNK